ncbi:MAG: UTP--glucose-1-phosphate uridylyltransferase GalU [Christensenellales bacterium]
MKIKKAVIPAAGLGTRFLPATKAQPKEMLPIVDKPTIQYIVEEAIASGIEEILIITGRSKRAVEDHFDESPELVMELKNKNKPDLLRIVEDISNMAEIFYIRQKQAKGLGHAVYCAKTFVGNEPFAIMLGDDIVHSQKPALQQLMEVYERYDASVLGVQRVPLSQTDKYGIVSYSQQTAQNVFRVHDLVEKPAQNPPSDMAIMGRYIVTPQIFSVLEHTSAGHSGEIQLTDALRGLLQKEPIYACVFEGRRYDVGDRIGFLRATVEFALRREDLKEEFADYLKKLDLNALKEKES